MIILSIRHHRRIGTHQHCEYKEGKALLLVIYEGEWSGNDTEECFEILTQKAEG